MWLWPSYWAAMGRGSMDHRCKPCGKLENQILFIHMAAAWWAHECCTTPAWGPPMGRIWDHWFRVNTHPTRNILTLASHWPHGILTKAAGEILDFLSLSEVAATLQLHWVRWLSFNIPKNRWLSCSECVAFVRKVWKNVINELHAILEQV